MDSAVKMVFYRKSKASSIVLWNKIFGQLKLWILTTENIYGTRLKFMTLQLSSWIQEMTYTTVEILAWIRPFPHLNDLELFCIFRGHLWRK